MSRHLRLRSITLLIRNFSTSYTAKPLKNLKARSSKTFTQSFIDLKQVKTIGGNGGDGCISFLHLYANEFAGPDGGDGGNGGHVIFKATHNVKDLRNVLTVIRGLDGAKGRNKDCHGKNADHSITEVPVGTIIRNQDGIIVGDLSQEDLMFMAARGGAGGKGNHFFISDTNQSPKICQYGATGEQLEYILEVKSMAHIGLIGFPNAGKSTLLRAISRASSKIAPYPFTTLKPQLGVVEYDDYEQIAVADLPGLIPGSHMNKGLGIQFLKHAERCLALIFVVDISVPRPWENITTLQFELTKFSEELGERPKIIIANKIDLLENDEKIKILRQKTNMKVIPISAKLGTNVTEFLLEIRRIYDKNKDIKE